MANGYLRVRSLSDVHTSGGGGRTFIRQLLILTVSPPSTSQRRALCAQTTYTALKPFQRRLLSVENNLLHQKPHLRRLCGTQSTVLKRKFEVRRFEADWSPQKPVRVSSTLCWHKNREKLWRLRLQRFCRV